MKLTDPTAVLALTVTGSNTAPAAGVPAEKKVLARPLVSVTALGLSKNPLPAVTEKATEALGSGFPLVSVIFTVRGKVDEKNSRTTCPSPLAMVTWLDPPPPPPPAPGTVKVNVVETAPAVSVTM